MKYGKTTENWHAARHLPHQFRFNGFFFFLTFIKAKTVGGHVCLARQFSWGFPCVLSFFFFPLRSSAGALLLLFLCLVGFSHSQQWPAKSVTIVVSWLRRWCEGGKGVLVWVSVFFVVSQVRRWTHCGSFFHRFLFFFLFIYLFIYFFFLWLHDGD